MLVIVLLVIEIVSVHKTSIQLDILDKNKLNQTFLSDIFPNAINQIMKQEAFRPESSAV